VIPFDVAVRLAVVGAVVAIPVACFWVRQKMIQDDLKMLDDAERSLLCEGNAGGMEGS
jgi:hypothetical protein